MVVLLVVQDFHWVFGQLASAICKYNPDITVLYADAYLIRSAPDEFLNLVQQSDIVHWITNLANVNHEVTLQSLSLRPTLAGMYHVVPGEEEKVGSVTKATHIHVMSSEWRDYLVEKQQVDPIDITVIPFGTDTDYYRYRTNRNTSDVIHLGSFANPGSAIGDRKGTDTLVRLIDRLRESNNLHFNMLLAGQNWRDFLDIQQPDIRHFGYVSKNDLRKLYHSLDFYLILSRIEGGPVTLLEALAIGVPVISTNVGMVKDTIKTGVNGMIVNKDADEEAFDTIKYLHSHPDLVEKLALNGRKTVEELDWKKVAPRFQQVYSKLVTTRQSKSSSQIRYQNHLMSAKDQRDIILSKSYLMWCKALIKNRETITAYQELFSNIPTRHVVDNFLRLALFHAKSSTAK